MSRRNQSGKRIAISFNPKELEAELHAERRASTVKVVDGLADWERELLEAPAAEVVTDVAEVETIATESAADEAGAEAKAEGDAAATAE